MPMFVCVFWALLFILHFKRENKAKKTLTVFMLAATLLYFAHCVFFNEEIALIPLTDTLYSLSMLSVYPLYFLYIHNLTDSRPMSWKNYLILFPAVFMFVVVAAIYLLMTEIERDTFIREYLYANISNPSTTLEKMQIMAHWLIKIIFAIQLLFTIYFGVKKVTIYDKKILSHYSNTENKTISPVKWLLVFFVMTSVGSFVLNIIGRTYFIGSTSLIVPSVLFSSLLFAIGYIGYEQEYTADDLQHEFSTQPVSPSDYKQETESSEDLKAQIVQLIENEKIYLQPNLKISDLANLLHTNRNYIYNAINVEMGVSFSEFINRYRVEYSQSLMSDNSHINLSEICTKSGFSSEVSFYRNFKLYTGKTPSQWIKSKKNSIETF